MPTTRNLTRSELGQAGGEGLFAMGDQASVGQRVRRLRLANGMAQSDLAKLANVASGSLSMVENGRHGLEPDALEMISAVLGCSADYLRRQVSEPVTTRPWLRAYADASKREVDRLVADSELAVEAARELDLRSIPDSIPAFDGALDDEDDIEQFAEIVRTAAGISPGSVVSNAVRASERLGVIVLPMDTELGRHMGLSLRVDGRPVIRVARASEVAELHVPGDRQRFTIAHELGHLSLHHSTPPPDSPSQAARIENQAHRFAGAFLVPADALLEDLDELGGRVTISTLIKLKERWGFSIKGFVTRFKQLGVIDDDQARSLYKQISARKMNKSEPVYVGNERARWMESALRERPPASLAGGARIGLDQDRYLARWLDWSASRASDPESNVVTLEGRRQRSW